MLTNNISFDTINYFAIQNILGGKMKKILILGMLLMSNLIMANAVNIYTERHYDADKLLFAEFEKQTGIKVNVVQAKADELIQKLELEGKDTPADVFLTVGAGNLYTAKGKNLLQKIDSKVLNGNIPKEFRDKDGNWFGLTYRARVFVYDPTKTNVKELSTYENLVNPKFKGQILTRTSTNSYNQHLIAALIANNGYDNTAKWAKGLVNNFARTPKGNDRDQAKAILSGEGKIAIMNTYYMGLMSVSKDPIEQEVFKKLRIFFPNQQGKGTHINISGAGVTKYAKNKANAIKFLEFLSEKKAQSIFAEANFEYPVNKKAELAPVVKSWGTFKYDKLSFEEIGKNIRSAQFLADEAGWK